MTKSKTSGALLAQGGLMMIKHIPSYSNGIRLLFTADKTINSGSQIWETIGDGELYGTQVDLLHL